MSFDLAPASRGCFYLNFRTPGDGTNKAEATQTFNNANLIDSTGNYIVAVERLVVPLQKIPMLPAELNIIQIVPIAGLIDTIDLDRDIFSIKEFIDYINDYVVNDLGYVGTTLYLRLDGSGRIVIHFENFANNNLILNQTLQDIFDLPQTLTLAEADVNDDVVGESSLVDRFDQLLSVQVEAQGLSVQQEIIDTNTAYEILTDFVIENPWSFSYSEPTDTISNPQVFQQSGSNVSISYPTRQNLIYNANQNRRYVMLVGFIPIQNLKVTCVAIYKDGSRNDIIMPPRTSFTMKLAFFKRK